jgi:ubiquinone/menaquinone biosynthesis C-methylase UbiE
MTEMKQKTQNNSVQRPVDDDATELGSLIHGMREAYSKGENAMEYARKSSSSMANSPVSTLIAYDLQAGNYIATAKADPDARAKWCRQLAEILGPYLDARRTVLEVGSGEATTLAGVLKYLHYAPGQALGLDISWSRCAYGRTWLRENAVEADLFVADLFEIPMEDSSVDVVYTSHSLEPNGGREEAAIKELLRVARRAVVLVEPAYELAGAEAQARMRAHGYVRRLKETAERIGAMVKDYRLLDYCGNQLNPSGLILIEKPLNSEHQEQSVRWRCPLTHARLEAHPLGYYSPDTGVVYPVLAGIPLLRSSHAVVASSFEPLAITRGSRTMRHEKSGSVDSLVSRGGLDAGR